MVQSLLHGHTCAGYVHNTPRKSKLFLSSALNPTTQTVTHLHFRACPKIVTQWLKTLKFWKSRTSSSGQTVTTWILAILNARNSACELQARGCAGRTGPQTPSVVLHMFLGLPATRTGSLKSPTSMDSVTRTISGFQPYVFSSPHKRIASKSIFWREDPSRQRGTGVQRHLLQWQTSLSALMHAASWGLKMWPSVCWPLMRTKWWVMPASSLQGSDADCSFLLYICNAMAGFWVPRSVSYFGEIMLECLPGSRSFAGRIYRDNSKLQDH